MLTETKLEPGRELDVRIAELRGWVEVHSTKNEFGFVGKPERDTPGWELVPHYSTDPAAALNLLQEVLKRDPFTAHIFVKLDGAFACWLKRPFLDLKVGGEHETLPGAIALACCAALESDRGPGGETK